MIRENIDNFVFLEEGEQVIVEEVILKDDFVINHTLYLCHKLWQLHVRFYTLLLHPIPSYMLPFIG